MVSWQKYGLPTATQTALEGLDRTTASCLYAGWDEGDRLDSRLGRATDWLKQNGLDGEALFVIIGALRYLTIADWHKLWQDVAKRLDVQFREIGTAKESARFVQSPGEGHLDRLFAAGEWQFRHNFLCPVDADRLLQMALSEEINSWIDLRYMNSTPIWVGIWDQSLSGKTMSTQLQRLQKCQAIMPTVSERYLIGACPLVTKEALDRLRNSCPAVYIVYAYQIDTTENLANVSAVWRKRVSDLCMGFYSRYVAPKQMESDRELRGVEAFGYKNSYALLLDHGNCPNNAPPVLWYSTNGYQPPFPRRASGHTTPAPDEVRNLDEDKMSAAAARLAFAFGVPPSEATELARKGRPRKYWRDTIWRCYELSGEVLASDNEVAGIVQRVLEWMPIAEKEYAGPSAVARAILLDRAIRDRDDAEVRKHASLLPQLIEDAGSLDSHDQFFMARGTIQEICVRAIPVLTKELSHSPEARQQLFVSLPRSRRHGESSPEPLTRRAACVAETAQTIRVDARVVALTQVLGWGKTWFADRVLAAVGKPVRIASLWWCADIHDVAEEILRDLPMDEHESRAVDRNPVEAVRLLLSRSATLGVMLLENADANLNNRLPERLEDMLRAFLDGGVPVVLETWMPPVLGRLDKSLLIEPTLLPIDRDEIQEWASRLGIQLSPDSLDALELLDGHPLLLRFTLERLQGHSVSPDRVLALAVEVEPAVSSPSWPAPVLGSALVTRVALLPFGRIEDDELDSAQRIEVEHLASFGLFHRDSSGSCWEATAWTRVRAIRRVIEGVFNTSLLPEVPAQTMPPDYLRTTHRHLEALAIYAAAAELRQLSDAIAGVRASLPIPDDYWAYTSASRTRFVTPDLSSTPGILAHLEWTVRVDGTCDPHQLEALLARADLGALLVGNWNHARSLHTVLLRGALSPTRHLAAYRQVLTLLKTAKWKSASPGSRLWIARLLAAGARTARRLYESEFAAATHALASEVLPKELPENPHACSLHMDTVWLLASAPTFAPRDSADYTASHLRALEAIPPREIWFAARANWWQGRELWHLYSLRRGFDDRALTQRIVRCFDAWTPSYRWAQAWYLFLDSWEQWDEPMRQELMGTLGRARERVPASDGNRIRALLALLDPNGVDFDSCLQTMRRSSPPRDDIDREIIRFAIARIDYSSIPVGQRGPFIELLEDSLRVLLDVQGEADTGDREEIKVVMRILEVLVNHEINLGVDGDEAKTLQRLKRAPLRIDGRFKNIVKRTANLSFLVPWAEARIQTARNHRWVHVRQLINETGFPRPVESNLEQMFKEDLTSFADRLLIVGEGHGAAVVGAIKVHHYLWNLRRCFELVDSLSDAALFEAGRLRSTRICTEVLYRVALLPGAICVEPFTRDEVERSKSRLCIMLDALSTTGGTAAYRRWCHRTASVLRDPSEDTWRRFIEANAERFGDPDEYWEKIVASSRAKPLSDTQVIDDPFSVTDLTDSADLQMASALLRFGALVSELPLELRRQLSELSMVMAVDAAAWRRSWHLTDGSLIDKWRCGLSIGIALALSADGRIRNTAYSHRAPGPSGQPLSWWQHCSGDLAGVSRLAPPQFAQHATKVLNWLKQIVPQGYRRQ